MKFLCLPCDRQMALEDRQQPGDGTFAVAYRCEGCGHEIAMLANPMETQLVGSLGVKIGGAELHEPFELVRGQAEGAELPQTPPGSPGWSAEAQERLTRVPSFVRGMVKRIYTEWAREHAVTTMTPEIMDRARTELGLEGM